MTASPLPEVEGWLSSMMEENATKIVAYSSVSEVGLVG